MFEVLNGCWSEGETRDFGDNAGRSIVVKAEFIRVQRFG